MNTAFLGKLLAGARPGDWVAISPDQPRILGCAADVDAVIASAQQQGEQDPIIVRVPSGPSAMLPSASAAAAAQAIPYEFMVYAVQGEAIVPFLGAGASRVGRGGAEPFQSSSSQFLPDVNELKELLAGIAKYPQSELQDSDLAKVSSYLAWQGGRAPLRYLLRQALGPPSGTGRRCEPGTIHKFIAQEKKIKLVITTNYDTLIEDAFRDIDRPYDLLVYPAELPAYGNAAVLLRWGAERPERLDPNSLRAVDGSSSTAMDFERTIIFKMHGSLWRSPDGDAFVITEEDYLQFLSRMIGRSAIPAPLMDYLSLKSLLFLGYGLRDWNLRLLLQTLNKPDKAWAIQRSVTVVEERLWKSRNVEIYDQDLSAFADGLAAELRRMRGEE